VEATHLYRTREFARRGRRTGKLPQVESRPTKVDPVGGRRSARRCLIDQEAITRLLLLVTVVVVGGVVVTVVVGQN